MVFTAPWLLMALVLIPLLAWYRFRALNRASLAFAPTQYRVRPRGRAFIHSLQTPLEMLLFTLVIIALAGPGTINEIENISETGLDVALVLDISASMQAADFPPNRLEALKEIAREFLHRAGGNRISVHAFAGIEFTQSPLTTDHRVVLELIEGLSYESIDHSESGGTAIGDALLGATDLLKAARIKGRDQVVILISDGESNSGVEPLLAARYLRDQNIRLHIIGIGGDQEVPVSVHGKPFINSEDKVLMTSLDDRQLKDIAAAGGGDYRRARSREVLGRIFEDLSRLERTPLTLEKLRLHSSWTAGIALLVFIVFAGLTALGHALRRPLR